ncbi:hypothetical protein AcV5_003025 [Taiwanofungus camphoratus]|nr:hypothetical protein AcV5_003025 [Antrodia cinnamomea]
MRNEGKHGCVCLTLSRIDAIQLNDSDELFMKLDASSSTRHISEEKQNMFNFDDRRTFATEPHRDLLSRVQRFLPQLAASNAELTRRLREDPRSIDLENIENDEHYIEMNLGLGVFEGRTASGSNSTDGEEDRSSSLLSSESSEQESESESDTDSDTSGGSDSDAGAR